MSPGTIKYPDFGKRSVREARVNLAADRRGSVRPLGLRTPEALREKDRSTPRSTHRLHPPPCLGVKQAQTPGKR